MEDWNVHKSMRDTHDIEAELAELFGNDQELAERLIPSTPSIEPPPPTLSLDESIQTQSEPEKISGPYGKLVLSEHNFNQPGIQQFDNSPAHQDLQEKFQNVFPLKGPGDIYKQQPETVSVSHKKEIPSAGSVITDRQLRALNRKHLLIMIRDLEKELGQTKEELENLKLAYRIGVSQNAQAG